MSKHVVKSGTAWAEVSHVCPKFAERENSVHTMWPHADREKTLITNLAVGTDQWHCPLCGWVVTLVWEGVERARPKRVRGHMGTVIVDDLPGRDSYKGVASMMSDAQEPERGAPAIHEEE